ncbi:MAG: asparagine synthase-related protein [Sulfuricaulis sp.]|nr:asparagine synthase-related protein [Sulfuricaulis sp.]
MTLLAAMYSPSIKNHQTMAGLLPPGNRVHVDNDAAGTPRLSFSCAPPPYAAAGSPMAAHKTSGGNRVLFHGRLFNAHELAAQLPERISSGDTAALVAGAYERWGTDCFARLRGQFVAVIVDASQQRVYAVRDPFGTLPLYYRIVRDGIAVASLAKTLLKLDDAAPTPNDRLVWEYLMGDLAIGEMFSGEPTFFNEVQRVKAGHYLCFADGRCEQRRYWEFAQLFTQPKRTDADPAEYLALLETVVREQCGDFKGVGAALSGGLDSTAIVLLMERVAGGRELSTISLGIEGQGEDETGNIEAVLKRVHARPSWVRPEGVDMFAMFEESAWHHECPSLTPSASIFHLLKKGTRQNGIDVLFSGLGADEVLGGMNLGYIADLFRSGHWLRMWRELHAYTAVDSLHFGRSPLMIFRQHVFDPMRLVRRRPPVPAWINRDFAVAQAGGRREAAEVLPGTSVFDQRTYEKLTRNFTQTFLHYEIHNAAACGIEHRFPYLDHRIMEYALRLPWQERMSGGIYKIHHRKAMARLLPPEILSQPKKTFIPMTHDRWLCKTYRDRIDALILNPQARCARYFDMDVVRQERAGYVAATDVRVKTNLRRSTWRALAVELWLHAFRL